MTEPLLRIDRLVVEYRPGLPVVNSASLDVRAGEVVGLFGRNGAGKTSAMRAVFGLAPRSGGRIDLFGQPLAAGLRPVDVARLGATMVLEGRGIFADMTVAENLRCAVLGNDHVPAIRRVAERYPMLGAKLAAPAGRLSGGEQQLLALVRASLRRPKLLVVDEISLGLSPIATRLALDALRGLAADGCGVLVADQNVSAVSGACGRGYLMDRGRIVGSSEGLDISAQQWVADIYLGGGASPAARQTTLETSR